MLFVVRLHKLILFVRKLSMWCRLDSPELLYGWNVLLTPCLTYVKKVNCKMQKCNALIFNLLQNLSLHFLQKGLKMGRFEGVFSHWNAQKTTKPTSLRWVFVLVHQVFDVDSHAEDGAGVDKYLAEEHQHRAVYLACGRKCQWDGAHGCAEGQKKNGAGAFHGSDHCAACHASKEGEKGFEQGFKKFS